MKYCTACNTKYDDSVSFCALDGEVLEADPASIVNTVLDGQYQMEALLGKGGMGAVYRARHILLHDRVAIKVLPPEVRNNAEWLRRFRREGQAARRFRHANAVTVYDLRTAADGTIYMVMEYVEGHTLDHAIKTRGRFTAAEACEVLTPIMSVLDTAHSMGVVHRDLKPENIMIGKEENGSPVVKLLDLGIAKLREIAGNENSGNTALTMAGQVLGTPYYMSPEQWGEIPRDGNVEIDGRADIYSLGLVFYEMILGRRCFSGNTLHELRREHVATKPKPLHEVAPEVPRAFSDAIERATAKDRGDRQATAGALATELRAALDSAPSPAPQVSNQTPGLMETVATSGSAGTHSDVNAPTMITMDGASATSAQADRPAATNAATVFEPAAPPPAAPPKPPAGIAAATVAESAAMPSVATVPHMPKGTGEIAPVVVAAPAKSKAGLLIGAAVLLVLILGGGVAGFLIWNKSKSNTVATTGPTNNSTINSNATAPREVGRYWLELAPADEGGKATKVAALVPIASGQKFQFHLVFNEDGYVYLLGPGSNNQTTAFLTSKPSPDSGLTTNKVVKGNNFSFPQGNFLTLDENPGTEVFTVVFSKTPLPQPFLNGPFTAEPLPAAHQTEWKAFAAKHKQTAPLTELDESTAGAPAVRIKLPPDETGNPIVFDIRIQHN